jgi:hypothetical protein
MIAKLWKEHTASNSREEIIWSPWLWHRVVSVFEDPTASIFWVDVIVILWIMTKSSYIFRKNLLSPSSRYKSICSSKLCHRVVWQIVSTVSDEPVILFSCYEDGCSMFLRNVCNHPPDYTPSSRRVQCSSLPPENLKTRPMLIFFLGGGRIRRNE